nr:MAG TPA: hypothetical protein [Bacteriophage sp.]
MPFCHPQNARFDSASALNMHYCIENHKNLSLWQSVN